MPITISRAARRIFQYVINEQCDELENFLKELKQAHPEHYWKAILRYGYLQLGEGHLLTMMSPLGYLSATSDVSKFAENRNKIYTTLMQYIPAEQGEKSWDYWSWGSRYRKLLSTKLDQSEPLEMHVLPLAEPAHELTFMEAHVDEIREAITKFFKKPELADLNCELLDCEYSDFDCGDFQWINWRDVYTPQRCGPGIRMSYSTKFDEHLDCYYPEAALENMEAFLADFNNDFQTQVVARQVKSVPGFFNKAPASIMLALDIDLSESVRPSHLMK